MSDSKKDLKRLDDIETINEIIDDYLRMFDHSTGVGFTSSPAPARMNRLIIKVIVQRIAYLTANCMALQLRQDDPFIKTSTAARIIKDKLPKEVKARIIKDKSPKEAKKLNELKVCDLQISKFNTIRKWIGSEISETYPDR